MFITFFKNEFSNVHENIILGNVVRLKGDTSFASESDDQMDIKGLNICISSKWNVI